MTTRLSDAAPIRRAGALLLPLLLAGCATMPSLRTPAIAPATAALDSRAAVVPAQPALADAPAPSRWWELFNDSVLHALEAGIDANLDLQTAILWIEESRAQLGLVDAARRPGLSTEVSYSRAAISEVGSLGPSSGASFSLVPPHNVTGNFTKIVQRLPVRIRLNDRQPDVARLRVGMSVTPVIQTRPERS